MRLNNVLRFRLSGIKFIEKLTFVPKHKPCTENDIKKLEDFLMAKPNVLVLTGKSKISKSKLKEKYFFK